MKNSYIEVPKYISDDKSYKGAIKLDKEYCIVFKHDKDDFSVWTTDDINDNLSGSSCRGNRDQILEEIKDTKFNEAINLLDIE